MYVNEMIYHSSLFMDEFSQIINGQAATHHELMKLFKSFFGLTPHVCTIIWLKIRKNTKIYYKKSISSGQSISSGIIQHTSK